MDDPGAVRLTNRNSIQHAEPGLIGIGIDPSFAIGLFYLTLSSLYPASTVVLVLVVLGERLSALQGCRPRVP